MQISLQTKDIFIECTATDLTKAQIVLNTVTTMFSEYCSTQFEVEPVEVVDALGNSRGVITNCIKFGPCRYPARRPHHAVHAHSSPNPL